MFRRYNIIHSWFFCFIKAVLLCFIGLVPLCIADKCFGYHGPMNGTSGRISSYMYPQNYLNNCNEKWSIQAPEGSIITISFNDIDMEIGDLGICNRDFLQIESGSTAVNFCQHNDTKVYISQENTVWLRFETNKEITRTGFDLFFIAGRVPSTSCKPGEFHCDNGKCIFMLWKCNKLDECGDGSDEANCPTDVQCVDDVKMCISQVTGKPMCLHDMYICDGEQDCVDNEDEDVVKCGKCVFTLTDWTGVVSSPKYPLSYPDNMDCEWQIHLPDTAAKVQLRFVDFDLQVDTGTDYVVVYDGGNRNQRLLGQFNHNKRPPAVIESSTNRLLLVFHSDSSVSEKGFNATFQGKGHCLSDQRLCGAGEMDCYADDKKCDGIWDCKMLGGDERKCGKCPFDKFPCEVGSFQCYHFSDHCNGVGYCANNADELNCSPIQCGPHNGTFLCDNGRCIYETWKCDHTNDCEDYSDEKDCGGSTNLVIIAAVAGSLICALLLVIALGCTCKLYALRLHDQLGGPRHETPMSRIQAHFMRRRAPPPYHEAMMTSRSYDEVHRALFNSSHGRRNRRSRRQQPSGTSLLPNPTNASDEMNAHSISNGNENERPIALNVDDSSTSLLPAEQQTSTVPLLLTSDSGEGLGSDLETDRNEDNDVCVSISQAAGISAHWRQPDCHKNNSLSCDNNKPISKPADSCIENVSASGDSIDFTAPDNVTKDGDCKNTDEIIPSVLGSQESLNSTLPPGGQLRRYGSHESLNSEGSCQSMGSQTQLVNS